MALTAVHTAMPLENQKDIHPFFTKPSPKEPTPEQVLAPIASHNDAIDEDHHSEESAERKGRKKRAKKVEGFKRKKNGKLGAKGQASLEKFARRVNGHTDNVSSGTPAVSADLDPLDEAAMEEDPNPRRSKRRKTESPAQVINVTSSPDPIQAQGHVSCSGRRLRSEEESPTPSALLATQPVQQQNPVVTTKTATPKKKLLRVNKNGKLLSSPTPPAPPAAEPVASTSPKKKRRRKSKARPSLMVTIRYGSDLSVRRLVGQKIENILCGGVISAPRLPSPKKAPSYPIGPPKSTHPFFTGKPAQKEEARHAEAESDAPNPPPTTRPRKTAVTPGRLKAETRSYQAPPPKPGVGAVFGSSRITKAPGTLEAPWPSRESAHVRNLGDSGLVDIAPQLQRTMDTMKPLKRKKNKTAVHVNEDLIHHLAEQLKPTIAGFQDRDPFAEPEVPDTLRLPSRLLTTGVDIQKRLRHEVRSLMSSKDSVSTCHPAISTIFRDIEHTLTPFDKGECDSQAWAQKYAPTSAAHVLQHGREAFVLRDWLQSLTVVAVRDGSGSTAVLADIKRAPKKKRKRLEDDFIISEKEVEEDTLVEFSDYEESLESKDSIARGARSLKCTRMSRGKNVIVLSGPHGCGKSAAVYAVAKELGFEVFEINSSSRRSGKDIQDRVGDMSENHLVNHQHQEKKATEYLSDAQADHEHIDEAFQKDLKSGKQGTMTSFFQSKPAAKAQPRPKAKAKEKDVGEPKPAAQATISMTGTRPKRLQKQSLILFEEADVLFEEDQQFWTQVTRLASQSKRPVVITCTDENLVPVWDLPLGAILRLRPPPITLATDYLLTLAAKEGHILKRSAVLDLYESRNCDLRASIAELNLWCQISVGDRKGGLDWIYQRWPPGNDVDEHGQTLRVASQDTYHSGMGLVSHDLESAFNTVSFDKEETLLRGMWTDWGIGPDAWIPSTEPLQNRQPPPDNPISSIQQLENLDNMFEAISSADVYSRIGLPTYGHFYDEPTDPTLPRVPEKEHLNYTVDAPFLQVDPVVDFSSFDTDVAIRSRLGIQGVYRDTLSLAGLTPMPFSPDRYTGLILQHRAHKHKQEPLSRSDFARALDILGVAPDAPPSALGATYFLSMTSFDRTFQIIVEDVAPYIRSIVSHELRLEAERLRIGNFLSEGGRNKRPRTTRASRVALEGGTRSSKRREFWFCKELNRTLVMATAGQSWAGLGSVSEQTDMSSRTGESVPGTQGEEV